MHPTSNKKVFGGRWWRFERYELKDGNIMPFEGSPFRNYEPWDEYHTPRGKKTIRQPYHSLIHLVNRIDRGELDQNDRDLAISEWCGQHGLLGVCIQTAGNIFVIPKEMLAIQSSPVIILPPTGGMFVHAISLGDSFGYDPPDEQAWRRYSESIETLLTAGRYLRELVEELQVIRDSKKRLVEKRAEFSKKIEWLIQCLVPIVRPIVHVETQNHFGLGWGCGSLLANFAMMAVLDFTSNRPLVCQNSKCGLFFVSKSTEAKYCSPQCRGAVQIRKYRAGLARKAKGKMK